MPKAVELTVGETEETKEKTCKQSTFELLKFYIPVIDWLPKYKWKEDFLSDLSAGFTVACVNVPQSLAFAALANVDLIYGLNTAVFSSFVYTLFGRAPISSFGPVAIGSMLTGEAVARYSESDDYTKDQYVSTLTVLIGIIYLIGVFLRLSVITIIFKKPFVSGFLGACTIHILIKTLKTILGLTITFVYGNFNIYFNSKILFNSLGGTNYPTVIISVSVLTVLILNMFLFRKIMSKFTKFILPIEALVLAVVTIISYYLNLEEKGVPVVGYVPSGFPKFVFPSIYAFGPALSSAIQIAIINYATTISLTSLFNDEVDPDREMFAMAVTNLICGNMQCITIGNSMMRTMVAINLGIKTLMATMICSTILLFIVLFGGRLFQPLPHCVLGCIIVIAAATLLYKRAMDVKQFYTSYEDLFIWFATLISTLTFDIPIGLIVGLTLSLRKILAHVVKTEKTEDDKENKSKPETERLLKPNPKVKIVSK